MPSVPDTACQRSEMSPLFRAALCLLWILTFLLPAAGGTPAQAANRDGDSSTHSFNLTPGLIARVDGDGGLAFVPVGLRSNVLRGELVSLTDSRRRRQNDIFFTVVAEGVEGGRRGFSARADDDQDGSIDEDPLDGIDNDRDGRIDEDFAAISDAMVAVGLREPGQNDQGVRLEFYHWENPRLNSAVFLSAGGDTPPGRATYRLQSAGSGWLETGIQSLRHTLAGQIEHEDMSAFVCRVNRQSGSVPGDPCDPDSGWWLGVMILADDGPARFLLEEGRLELPLGEEAVPLVLCAADSWLQLNRILGEARAVHRGLADPVDNRRAPWIIPPSCAACQSTAAPDFDLEMGPNGDRILTANIDPGQCGLLDPDLFQVEGSQLGSPRLIRWRSVQGHQTEIAWACPNPNRLNENGPASQAYFRLLANLPNHQHAGRLTFVFDPRPGLQDQETQAITKISGHFLDGRVFRSLLEEDIPEDPQVLNDPEIRLGNPASHDPEPDMVQEKARGYAEARARLLKSGRQPPSLSPELLVGWPNPFNDIINIRFKVPGTMREAFIWKNAEEQPTDMELEGEVPWPGGQPSVSVKIYSMGGQELVTLHSATESVGEYTAQWNGTDAFGRKVASGTYFCKLQMDDWSVTRSLVFLR